MLSELGITSNLSHKVRVQILELEETELLATWQRLNTVISRLTQALVTESDVLKVIDLEDKIREREDLASKTKAKIDQLQAELDLLRQFSSDSSPPSPNLQNGEQSRKLQLDLLLLGMDFYDQSDCFHTALTAVSCDIYAFLVYGLRDHGHIWLLKKILDEIPNGHNTPLIQHDFRNPSSVSDVEKLWRILAKKIVGASPTARDIILKKIVERLKTQNVILILHGIDYMDDVYFNEIIQDFWQPLIDGIQKYQSANTQYKVLMFLVDYKGEITKWNINTCNQIDQEWSPVMPIKLPAIEKFSRDILNAWLRSNARRVMPNSNIQQSDLLKQILDRSDSGIPGRVLQVIYELCGYDLDDEEEKWSKLH